MTSVASDYLTFRPHTKNDLNFVRDSWSKTSYQYNDLKFIIPPEVFNSFHKQVVNKILNSPTTAIIVVCAPDDPNTILAWACVEKPPKLSGSILHFIYVKEILRNENIATSLLEKIQLEEPVIFTSMTRKASKILVKHKDYFKRWFYEPSLINGFIKKEQYWYETKRPATR